MRILKRSTSHLGLISAGLAGLGMVGTLVTILPNFLPLPFVYWLYHPLFLPLGQYLLDKMALWSCLTVECLGAGLLAGVLSRKTWMGRLGAVSAGAEIGLLVTVAILQIWPLSINDGRQIAIAELLLVVGCAVCLTTLGLLALASLRWAFAFWRRRHSLHPS